MLHESARNVELGLPVKRLDERVDVAPRLRPHVAEKMRGDRRMVANLVFPIRLLERCADVTVERVVERLHLSP